MFRRNKYNAKKVVTDGIKFDSIKEGKRYVQLKLLRKIGEIKELELQPLWKAKCGIKYKADFLIIWRDGTKTIEDVKGFKTPEYKLKKKLFEYEFNFKIIEV
jgi:hypothetical protein